jgi:hypothetical protein
MRTQGKPGLLLGLLSGLFLTLTLVAIFYLGYRLAALPFPPFNLFDWPTRILPGSVLAKGINTMVSLRLFCPPIKKGAWQAIIPGGLRARNDMDLVDYTLASACCGGHPWWSIWLIIIAIAMVHLTPWGQRYKLSVSFRRRDPAPGTNAFNRLGFRTNKVRSWSTTAVIRWFGGDYREAKCERLPGQKPRWRLVFAAARQARDDKARCGRSRAGVRPQGRGYLALIRYVRSPPSGLKDSTA